METLSHAVAHSDRPLICQAPPATTLTQVQLKVVAEMQIRQSLLSHGSPPFLPGVQVRLRLAVGGCGVRSLLFHTG